MGTYLRNTFLAVIYLIFIILSFSKGFQAFKYENLKERINIIYPLHFPQIIAPIDNPMNDTKIFLGEKLFFEKALSVDSSLSCATCHQPQFAFSSNGNRITPGLGGNYIPRNVPPVFNEAFYPVYFWDGHSNSLEDMFYFDLHSKMIFGSDTNVIVKRLNQNPDYVKMFNTAFDDLTGITPKKISYSIADFVRSIVSGNSRYDEYIQGNKSALSVDEIKGMNMFFSDRTNCSVCHSGLLFTDGKFHSTGISIHYFDRGRYYITNNNADRGKFRTPSLRNIELTPPYMHDGEIKTLEDVLEHYNRGGQPFINKSPLIKSLNLNENEKRQIICFLKSLTDYKFVNKYK